MSVDMFIFRCVFDLSLTIQLLVSVWWEGTLRQQMPQGTPSFPQPQCGGSQPTAHRLQHQQRNYITVTRAHGNPGCHACVWTVCIMYTIVNQFLSGWCFYSCYGKCVCKCVCVCVCAVACVHAQKDAHNTVACLGGIVIWEVWRLDEFIAVKSVVFSVCV